jgi:hypothetical protein
MIRSLFVQCTINGQRKGLDADVAFPCASEIAAGRGRRRPIALEFAQFLARTPRPGGDIGEIQPARFKGRRLRKAD